MSLPKAVFLDTSVFAGQQYNYASAILVSFIPVAQNAELLLLLPDPTEREVARQIKERASAALKALEDARRKAPFLSKWDSFPPKQKPWAEWEVLQVAKREWQDFLKHFQVEKLGYEEVSVPKVMSWYDDARAPFGEGKKRKEFPDAFAIEILSIYAEKNNICVAVVSGDKDMQRACEYYPSLLYFPSLAQLTELLLLADQEIDELRGLAEKGIEILEEALQESIGDFETYLYDDTYKEEESLVHRPQITDIRIVGLGHSECTVVFEAEYESEHRLAWEEVVDPTEGYMQEYSDWISQSNYVSGTAKLNLDRPLGEICSVGLINTDQSEIELDRVPSRW